MFKIILNKHSLLKVVNMYCYVMNMIHLIYLKLLMSYETINDIIF